MTDAAFALFQQAHAAAAAARKAYDDACDADASDSRLALLRERAEHAERARDVARDVYVASRGPSSDDSTLIGRIGHNWGPLLIVLNGVIANTHPNSAQYLSGTIGTVALFLFLYRVCKRRR